jgi:hypothetical protein
VSESRRSRLPSTPEVLNGTYIDFEGFGKNLRNVVPPPVLLGIYKLSGHEDFDAGFRQIVFNKDYVAAVEERCVAHEVLYEPDRDRFLTGLVQASRKTAPLFAFSLHERQILQRACGYRLDHRYRNVLAIAKLSLRNSSQKPRDKENGLRSVCEAMGIPLTFKLPRGGVTDRLRTVREYSSSQSKWRLASTSVRQAWREILLHNYADVKAIYEIVRRLQGGPSPSGALSDLATR